jgi:hypothetical protein
MTIPAVMHRRSDNPAEPAHRFSVGQAVRLIGDFRRSHNVNFITAKLSPNEGSPQYRIRDKAEGFERMAMEANLEPLVAADKRPQLPNKATSVPSQERRGAVP